MDNKFGVWKPYPDYEPEPGECYIVAWLPKGEHYHSHFYEIAEYTGEGWDQTDFPFARKGAEVIAWMELPEMYKEEDCDIDYHIGRLAPTIIEAEEGEKA